MKQVSLACRAKSLAAVLHECSGFVNDGYVLLFVSASDCHLFHKYKHRINGSILSVSWEPCRYTIRKDSVIVKQVCFTTRDSR